jgi:precorrin-8X/cobalt-precorrin-8 methylmutase
MRLHEQGELEPALVVGMPVGFVNAAEAKEMLMASGLAYISVAGRKGGSAVAAATVNAVADLAANESNVHGAMRKT